MQARVRISLFILFCLFISAGPAWARHLQEAFARQQAILTWWFTDA